MTEDGQAKAWAKTEHLLRTDYEDPDIEAVKSVCVAVAAHRITAHFPVWLMCVAPSGSLKTVALESLNRLPGVHFIDEVTPNTFVSGRIPDRPKDEKGKEKKTAKKEKRTPASLLHRIGKDGFLVAADFSTVLSMDERSRARILAQLRRIYDGQFSREFGTEEGLEEREWEGRLTMITGVTPDIDSQYLVFRSLGERFVQVRWPRAGGVKTAMKAMNKRKNAASDLRNAIRELLKPILDRPTIRPPFIPLSCQERLAHLGEFVALARASVPRARNDHEPIAPPSPEGNTRLPQQFAQLARGSAVLAARGSVNEGDFNLAIRVALDCIPGVRRTVIQRLLAGKTPHSKDLSGGLLTRTLEDLEALGLVDKALSESVFTLTDTASILLAGAGVTSPKMERDDLKRKVGP